ncbi:hypothetical protein [Bacillus sp. 03113]|uniref:hypothetical protein n=1 Tax=Bacillus sp. 03113 TaxID=2578211 RepID=UPI00215C0475|nr:hypothetical protein [Bacillus sp. 03113]
MKNLESWPIMKLNSLLFLSIISSILVILYQIFQWSIIEILTPFLMPLLSLVVYGFAFVVIFISILSIRKGFQWKPIIIQGITILLVIFFPFTKIVLDIDFKMNKSDREEVIRMVEKGTLKPNVSHNSTLIQLPEKYAQLSKGGGEIIIDKNGDDSSVLFFTFRGVLDNFSGFVYSPNDQRPSNRDFDGDFKQVEKLDENWYFVGSY